MRWKRQGCFLLKSWGGSTHGPEMIVYISNNPRDSEFLTTAGSCSHHQHNSVVEVGIIILILCYR